MENVSLRVVSQWSQIILNAYTGTNYTPEHHSRITGTGGRFVMNMKSTLGNLTLFQGAMHQLLNHIHHIDCIYKGIW